MILYQRGPESNFPACRIEHALHISSYYRSRTLQSLFYAALIQPKSLIFFFLTSGADLDEMVYLQGLEPWSTGCPWTQLLYRLSYRYI